MSPDFEHDVFLSHSANDKAVVCPLTERSRKDGLKVWFDEWELGVAASRESAANSSEGHAREVNKDGGALPRRRYEEMIEAGLEHSRVLVLRMSANAFGSGWGKLESYLIARSAASRWGHSPPPGPGAASRAGPDRG